MVFVQFALNCCSLHTYIHTYIHNRTMPIALFIGIPVVALCYLLVNIAFFAVLNYEDILGAEAVALVSWITMHVEGYMTHQLPAFFYQGLYWYFCVYICTPQIELLCRLLFKHYPPHPHHHCTIGFSAYSYDTDSFVSRIISHFLLNPVSLQPFGEATLGKAGLIVIPILVAFSTFGAANGGTYTSSRSVLWCCQGSPFTGLSQWTAHTLQDTSSSYSIFGGCLNYIGGERKGWGCEGGGHIDNPMLKSRCHCTCITIKQYSPQTKGKA